MSDINSLCNIQITPESKRYIRNYDGVEQLLYPADFGGLSAVLLFTNTSRTLVTAEISRGGSVEIFYSDSLERPY